MGYAVYEHRAPSRPQQFAGYGVVARCDYPECSVEIDRGFSYACGGDGPLDHTCGGYFCGEHQNYDYADEDSDDMGDLENIVCLHSPEDRDMAKPEHPDWIKHVETDDTWEEFRTLYPDWKKDWETA